MEDGGGGLPQRGSAGMGLPETLAEATVEMIGATAGVVAPRAEDITTTFYRNVFAKMPQLHAYFNVSNNASLAQPKALAASVVAYASNISDLSPLVVKNGAVETICHKHCALNIVPAFYPIVHDNLMEAVGQVLGEAVTPPVAAAWSESVLFLAKVMIDLEERLYQEAESRSGGWRGLKPFVVDAIEDVATGTKRFTFRAPSDGRLAAEHAFDFTPGQYLSLKVDPDGDGLTAPRHYTVTSPPGADFLQCTVKRVCGGKVSGFLHEQLRVGDTVQLSPPFGTFQPHESCSSVVLMSAGIGVTPMVNLSRNFGDAVKLVSHVDKAPKAFAWLQHFEDAGHQVSAHYTAAEGRPTPLALAQEAVGKAGPESDFYVCGPPCWMAQVQAALVQEGARNVFAEAFGPQLGSGCPMRAGAVI